MSLKDSFCASPWFHMRITNNGDMNYCRWNNQIDAGQNISQIHPITFFQQGMSSVRASMLSGSPVHTCHECHDMEQHGKISGRQRQLLKAGVQLDKFEKTMLSSPWASSWNKADGVIDQYPQDWQIDLGNYCNSACVFCSPRYSSRLAQEWKKIGWIDTLPSANWTDNPVLVQTFIDTLKQSPNVQYLHFIGGETLITPAFVVILQALVDAGLHRTATIGFTTNLTVWKQDVVDLMSQFSGVNLGMSIETLTPVNDYVRWPSQIDTVRANLDRWVLVAKQNNWLVQLRTTPNVLTIHDLLTVYDWAWEHGISIESCNFLTEPKFLQPAVLPVDTRHAIIEKMKAWSSQRPVLSAIVNTRDPNRVNDALLQDLLSYIHYLENQPDHSDQLPKLMQYLRTLESSRNNKVLDYLPQYEQLFRSAGY